MAIIINTPSRRRLATGYLNIILGLAITAGLGSSAALAADAPLLRAKVTTNRGCLETGDAATFAVGEAITIKLRAESGAFNVANGTLWLYKPGGFVAAFGVGWMFTNETYVFNGRVGWPAGIHKLRFKATAGGYKSSAFCSFNVVPQITTHTPQPTRTPTATRTITPTHPPAPPGAALQAHVTTNRGCDETGDNPIFYVGEKITVSFGVDSDSRASANVTLYDNLANGFVKVFSFGTLLTNKTYNFPATIAPPLGTEVLRLHASAYGVPSSNAYCSFTVAIAPTRTRTPSRTPTVTRTPTSSRTSTPTRTATATATVP